jgi:hypothetical protein
MEYAIRAGDDGEPANRRWLLEQDWIKATAEHQEVSMTLEERAEFIAMSSRPQQRGRDWFGGRRYDLVRLEDGTIDLVRNALDAEIERALANALVKVYGPEPAEDD